MRYIISLCLLMFFSTNMKAMNDVEVQEKLSSLKLVPTIETEQTQQDTRALFTDFQEQYKLSGVLHPWGLGQDPDPRMKNMNTRKTNGNSYLDQIVYQDNKPIAYVNLGQMPVKGYGDHPIIAKAWNELGFTDEERNQKEGIGVGYIAFGFAKGVNSDTIVDTIKTTLGFVKERASEGKLLPIQNLVPTHFTSLIALNDPLIEPFKSAGIIIKNTENNLGYPGFDSAEEGRNRVMGVYTF